MIYNDNHQNKELKSQEGEYVREQMVTMGA